MVVSINIYKGRLYTKERIKHKRDISAFFDSSCNILKFYGSYYNLFVNVNNLDYARFFVSVKRNTCNAPKRNRAKRIVREIFRTNKDLIPKGCNYFILVKRECNLDFNLYREDLLALFKRVSK